MICSSGVGFSKMQGAKLCFRFCFVFLAVFFVLINPLSLSYSFGSDVLPVKDKDNIIEIEGSVITVSEFSRAIELLHTSDRVGARLTGGGNSFEMMDFGKYLQELIDRKLKALEAEKLNLDENPDVAAKLYVSRINYLLNKHQEEMVEKRIMIYRKEVVENFLEQREQQARDRRELKLKLGKIKPDEEPLPDFKSEEWIENTLKGLTPSAYTTIAGGFKNIKKAQLEKEFFEKIRKKGKIKVNKKIVKKFAEGDSSVLYEVIAKARRGVKVYSSDVLARIDRSKIANEAEIEKIADDIAMERLVDKDALSMNYDKKDDKLAGIIAREREKIMAQAYRDTVINGMIQVSAKEIEEYYEKNKDLFLLADSIEAKIIKVSKMEEARRVLSELEAGVDFDYLAKSMSLDPSKDKGGYIGWKPIVDFPQLDPVEVVKAGPGVVAGPYQDGYAFVLVQIIAYKEGEPAPLDDSLRKQIDLTIGKTKVEPTELEVMTRLRSAYKIRYNTERLNFYGIKLENL